MAYRVTWVQNGTPRSEVVSPAGARTLEQYLRTTLRITPAVERI